MDKVMERQESTAQLISDDETDYIEKMGNQHVNGVFHEEQEPELQVDENSYMIHSVLTRNHQTDPLGRPVVVFNNWDMLKSDLKGKSQSADVKEENGMRTYFQRDSDGSDASSSYEELSHCNMTQQLTAGAQSNHSEDNIFKENIETQPMFAKNTQSLCTLNDCRTSDQEVTDSNSYRIPVAAVIERAASVDALSSLPCKKPESLQQRRNKRPTSLQIPSIIDIPPVVEDRTARLDFISLANSDKAVVARQRSHSMPSTALLELREEVTTKKLTLDEALSLISKKKLTKTHIDEQSLLHRAADAGHINLLKKCIKAGCSLNKRLDMLNGTTALHCAVRADNNAMLVTKSLLEAGIDVNVTNDLGETAIFSAIIHKHMECVDLLVDYGCDLGLVWQDSTPLYLMFQNRNLETSCKVIRKGAKITHLPEHVQQPLHAVLDLCCSNMMTYNNILLLKAIVQADGNVVKHLNSYSGLTPGCSQQDIIRQIYSMAPGPEQDEGKRLIRSLIKLGYKPSRGELSFMSESDTDYDYLYSYVTNGPAPLKDLCVRAARSACMLNVMHAVKNWPQIQCKPKEKAQILLEPTPEPEPDYENVVVRRRQSNKEKNKDKSHRRSLKSFVSGFQRLSRRFSKKNHEKKNEPVHLAMLTLHQEDQLSREKSESLPSGLDGTDTTNNNKPRFMKRNGKKKDITVRDIVKRYSNSDRYLANTSEENNGLLNGIDNKASSNPATAVETARPDTSCISYTSTIELPDPNPAKNDDPPTPFENVDKNSVPFYSAVHTLDRNYKYSSPQSIRNPLKDCEAKLSYGVFKSSIHVTGDGDY